VIARVVVVGIVLASAACVSTKDLMMDAVTQRAMQDLTCDEASTKVRQLGVISHYQGGRQGTVERATFSAAGCGDSEVYNVECVRGICIPAKDVAPKDKDKKAPSYYDDGANQ
jgi:hypothetical protein